MQICYLLETSELCGGVRVVFDQAGALTDLGHKVMIRSRTGDHRWYPYPVNITYVPELNQPFTDFHPDIVVGTFWTTIKPAIELGVSLTVHLCQGCEWLLPEYMPIKNDIEAVYGLPIPKITIGKWLNSQIWERFGKQAFPVECVGQMLDTDLFKKTLLIKKWVTKKRIPFLKKNTPFRILLTGIYESSVKGIDAALEAVAIVRQKGHAIHLTRISTMPLSDQEKQKTGIDAYYHNIPPVKMAQCYHEADLLLAPSRAAEGFGLPFAEAMASGLPAVATAIPSHLSMNKKKDYALFVPEGDPEAMAQGIIKLMLNNKLRCKTAKQALKVVKQNFSKSNAAHCLESAFIRLLKNE